MVSHARTIAKWFNLGLEREVAKVAPVDVGLPGGGEILLLTGASGSGKSTLLGKLKGDAIGHNREVIDLCSVDVAGEVLTVDALGMELGRTLRLLSLVGLAEAQTYLLPVGRLSEGQRWRLRLAVAIGRARGEAVVFCDEFAAVLDRVTAVGVARALRRVSRLEEYAGVGFVVATSHSDLGAALEAEVTVVCDFERYIVVRG